MNFDIRQRLPWRVQQVLTTAFYVEQMTEFVFRRVLQTPAMPADPLSSLDVLTLLDRGNVNNYLLGIKSLLLHLRSPVAVSVLSDGSLRSCDIEILMQHVPGIRVVTKQQIAIPSSCSAVIDHWCTEYRYLAKLMYLPFTTDKPSIMILDSDVMFRRQLPATFLALRPGIATIFNRDHDHSRNDPCFHYLQEYAARRGICLINNLNCGLMLWERSQLRPLDAIGFLEFVVQRHGSLHAVAEQDAWTLLASQLPYEALPLDFLVLSNWEHNNRQNRRNALSIHYVRGERYRGLDYLKDGWRTMRLLHENTNYGPSRCCSEHPVSCEQTGTIPEFMRPDGT